MMFLGRGNYEIEIRPQRVRNENDIWVGEKTREELHKVINQFRDKDLKTIKYQVRRCYPFGDRRGRNYKIWNRIVHEIFKALDEGTFKFDSP